VQSVTVGSRQEEKRRIEEKNKSIALYFLSFSVIIAFLFFNLAGVIALYFFSF
jgi:membrane protein insertase Oxa1/YidC/SpoIIIJ